MLTYVEGDLLTSPAHTLVNPVNVVGVMGQGLALHFKQVYPAMFAAYQTACHTGAIAVGRPWLYPTSRKWIVNFPTKRHWRHVSRLDDIEAGLRTLARTGVDAGMDSIAFPALGCGNGALAWHDVRPLMERYLRPLPMDVFIYPPKPPRSRPEPQVPVAICEWLRSEPLSLSASQVWADLVAVARRHFTVLIAEVPGFALGPPSQQLQFESAGQAVPLWETDFEGLWDIVYTHGFLDQSVLRQWLGFDTARVLWDLLIQLPYLDVVHTAHDASHLPGIPTLQLRLPARHSGDVLEFEVSVVQGG